jgi:peptidoglycan/xylan/chitin deacetylase (PgdA/CDA1 family)
MLLGYVKRAKHESFREGVITSIYFHNPGKKLFKEIVVWLRKNGYTFISSDQLIDILHKRIPCPRGAVWLSLDDGWKGNIDNVIPTAVEYNIPITTFVYTGAVEDGTFWWEEVKESAHRLPAGIGDAGDIRKLSEDKRRQVLALISETESAFRRKAMTVEDVRRISAIPQVTIGSHTVSHPILSNCTAEQVDYELQESKRKLEEWTAKPIRLFAYPNGAFNGKERQFLQKYGYELAVTTEPRFARLGGDPYLHPRTDVMDDGSLAENVCHLLGVWAPVVSRVKGTVKTVINRLPFDAESNFL